MGADPLIVTLILDPAAQARFDALRATHFPPDRLLVGAHATLFHALPGEERAVIADTLARQTATMAPFDITVGSVWFLGRGVAFTLDSPVLSTLRANLRQCWHTLLTPQDRQGWRPHVTIQNKVDPATARALHDRLNERFVRYTVTGIGLALWHYRGGPWEQADVFAFGCAGSCG